MTGQRLVAILDKVLKERGISKGELCSAIGVSANTYSHWAKGSEPKASRIEAIEKYLGIRLSDIEMSNVEEGDDVMRIRQQLRTRPEAKTLFDAAEGAPASVYHEAAALFLRWKEENEGK